MTASTKLEALAERKRAVQQELQDLADAKRQSANTALADLESALLAELERIDRQLEQIRAYVGQCRVETGAKN